MVYFSSDLHGYSLEGFLGLLESAGFSDDDYLFILGDVIDRGEDGVNILKWLLVQPNVELILGNHEAMLLACDFLFLRIDELSLDTLGTDQLRAYRLWQSNGAEPTLRALRALCAEEREDILLYLRECPLYDTVAIGDRDFLLVHGGLSGFEEDKPITAYEPYDLLWTRPSLDDRYSSRFLTVLGHTPTRFYGSEYRGKMLKMPTWVNIDTGAASPDGAPMLLRLDDMQEFYIKKT